MSTARIEPELITFLAQLKKNNNREWFQKNRRRDGLVKARRTAVPLRATRVGAEHSRGE